MVVNDDFNNYKYALNDSQQSKHINKISWRKKILYIKFDL